MRRDERGFTLAEVVIALAALSLVLFAVFTIEQQAKQAWITGSNRTAAQQNARLALVRMARQIRESTTALAAGSTTQSLSFTLPDPVTGVPVPGVQVTYALVGDTLQCTGLCDGQTVSVDPVKVIGSVLTLTFTYRDRNAVAVAPQLAFRVDITITTASEDAMGGGIADAWPALTTSVQLRNA